MAVGSRHASIFWVNAAIQAGSACRVQEPTLRQERICDVDHVPMSYERRTVPDNCTTSPACRPAAADPIRQPTLHESRTRATWSRPFRCATTAAANKGAQARGVQDGLSLRSAQAQQQRLGYLEFLFGDEIERRANRALGSRLSKAHFEDSEKTFENFDWTFNPKLPQEQLRDLAAGGYLVRKEHGCRACGAQMQEADLSSADLPGCATRWSIPEQGSSVQGTLGRCSSKGHPSRRSGSQDS